MTGAQGETNRSIGAGTAWPLVAGLVACLMVGAHSLGDGTPRRGLVGVIAGAPAGVVLNGVILGLVAALGAVGLSLVWRANRVVNFAQGDLGVFPATLAVLVITLSGWNHWLGMGLGIVLAPVVGLVADVLVVRRFFRAPRLTLTVATIGLAQLAAFGALLLPRAWGAAPTVRSLPAPFDWGFSVGLTRFDANDVLALVVAPLLILGVGWFLRRTPAGVAIRASAVEPDLALSLGVPVRRLEAVTWMMSTTLACVAVLLSAGVAALPFGPSLGPEVLTVTLAPAVLGGFTNLPAIVGASVALGLLRAQLIWVDASEYVMPMLAVLILGGLWLGRSGRERSRGEEDSRLRVLGVRPVPASLNALVPVRATRWAVATILLLLAVALPDLPGMDTAADTLAAVAVCFAIIGVSVVVLTGWAGQVSLGQMAFAAAGAGVAVAAAEAGWDPVVVPPLAFALGAVCAAVVGVPALRVKGLQLAVATLAVGVAVDRWVLAADGLALIPPGTFETPLLLGRIDLAGPPAIRYRVALAVLVLVLLAAGAIRRSRTGRVMFGLRDNEDATRAFGVVAVRARLGAFALSGGIAAIGGAMLSLVQGTFVPTTFSTIESLSVFMATVVGGVAMLPGAVIGAAFLRGGQYLLPSPWNLAASGVGVLAVLTALPGGIGGAIWRWRDRALAAAARRHGVEALALTGEPEESPEEVAA